MVVRSWEFDIDQGARSRSSGRREIYRTVRVGVGVVKIKAEKGLGPAQSAVINLN